MSSHGRWKIAAALVAALALLPAAAHADQPYRCARDSRSATGRDAARPVTSSIELVPHRPRCARRPVPMPTVSATQMQAGERMRQAAATRRSDRRRGGVHTDSQVINGVTHFYAVSGAATPNAGNVNEMWGIQTNERPYVDTSGDYPFLNFSLSQLWYADDSTGTAHGSTAELGWQVSPGLWSDTLPHLFIFPSDNAYQSGCYARYPSDLCGGHYHQYSSSVYPGMPLTYNDVFHTYGIVRMRTDTGSTTTGNGRDTSTPGSGPCTTRTR